MTSKLMTAMLMAAGLALAACGSDATTATGSNTDDDQLGSSTTTGIVDETKRLWIKPDLVECEGSAPQMCMQVAESEDGEFEYFYDQIEGFDFVEGTSYVIDVTVQDIEDPPADGSSIAYTLVEIIEETDVSN